MPSIKLTLTETEFSELQELCQNQNISMQDYIRHMLFKTTSIFTPEEAYKRAMTLPAGTEFSLPQLYTSEEWSLTNSEAGVFGRKWYKYTVNSPFVDFVGYGKDHRAHYVRINAAAMPENSTITEAGKEPEHE